MALAIEMSDTSCKEFQLSSCAIIWARSAILTRSGREAAMKPYIIGAICVWFISGIAGAVMLGQTRVDIPTIAGGPITFWNGLNRPVDG
jgi:hypothetical protein